MKRAVLRRKSLFRALRAAAFAFLCWIGAQRQAAAQTFTHLPFMVSGTTVTTASGVYTGNYGFVSGSTYNLTIGANTSVTNTSASGYHGSYSNTYTPFNTVSLGGGSLINEGTLSLAFTPGTGGGYGAALVMGSGGDSTLNNDETISLSILANGSAGYGVLMYSTGSSYMIANNAFGATISSSVFSSFGGMSTSGLEAHSGSGAITVTNYGTISSYGSDPSGHVYASGVYAISGSGYVHVSNYGDISATSNGGAHNRDWGIEAETTGTGSVYVYNHGTIETAANSTASYYSQIYGIYNQMTGSGNVTDTNAGTITASAPITVAGTGSYVYGIGLQDSGTGAITINNTGSGTINVSGASCSGLYALQANSGLISINNTGHITATATASSYSGTGSAYGIVAEPGNNGTAAIVNGGTVTVSATDSAYGLVIRPYYYNNSPSGMTATITNTGTVTVTGTNSYGIYLGVIGTVNNSGNVTAGTAAIWVPSGSTVNLTGSSGVISGLIQGGTTASSTSILNFELTVPTAALAADKSALNAAIAAYDPSTENGGSSYTFTINGLTYTIEDFGDVIDDLIGSGAGGGGGNPAAQQFTQNFSQIAAQNPQYSSMAGALGSLPATPQSTALLTALNNLPVSELPAALSQLSTVKVSQQLLSQPSSQAVFQNLQLDDRLTQVRSGLADGIDASDFQLADVTQDPLLSQVQSKLYAYNPAPTNTLSDTPNPLSSDESFARWGTFLSGNAVLSNQNATASQSRADSTTVDITAGADYRLNKNWAVGFLFGYGRTTASIDTYGSTLDGNQYRFGPYVGYNDGPWYANASGTFAVNQETSDRVISFLGQTAQSNPDGTQYGLNADGGYDFKAGHLTYGPTGGLQYTHLNVGAYTETGSDADLSVASQQSDSLLSSFGGKADYDLHWNWNNATIRPEIRASWLHEFEGNNSPVNAAFDVPGSASFTMAAAHQERESALLGGGVQNIFKGGSLLFVDYDAQVQDNYLAQSITGGFKILF